MPQNDIECESFTVIFIDSLLVFENKYYLNNCAYKLQTNKSQIILMTIFYFFWRLDLINFAVDEGIISEGIDPTKSNSSKEWMICHYWFFKQWFKFQDSVCNGCHDLTILCLNISNIAIITV